MALNEALGTLEVLGLPAAIAAADVACKTANVSLVGYETTDGMGMVTVKITGRVSAVQSAISAAKSAAGQISRVFADSVIPRPNEQVEPVVLTPVTVGMGAPAAAVPDGTDVKPDKPVAADVIHQPPANDHLPEGGTNIRTTTALQVGDGAKRPVDQMSTRARTRTDRAVRERKHHEGIIGSD